MTPSHAPPPESKASKFVDNAMNALDPALSILNTVTGLTANVPYLNAVTGVIKNLIEIREAVKSNKERADVLFEKIGTITQTIAAGLLELNDAHRRTAADALKGDLEKYNSVLVDAAHILKEWTSQSIMQRVLKRSDFDGIADNLERRIEAFRDAFSVARLTALSKGQHETNAMLTTLVDSDTRMKLEKWLKPADLAVSDRNASKKKHPGTGKWLLENSFEFSEWVYDPMSFLWLHGISGSGKTVLSSMIIDRIRQLGVYAFFYFDINSPQQQQTVNNLLCSLVHQLSGQLPCPALSTLWETCQNGGRLPSDSDLLSILKEFGGTREIYLLVDALDECSERDTLLEVLASILEAKLPKMHLTVTSRTEVTHSSLAKEAVLVSLEESVCSDIELYVADELSKMGGYIAKNKDDIRKKLLDKGGNMFRLVALQLEALQKSGGTKSKVTKALATMPTTLGGIYDRILEMTDMHDQVCRAINWLIFCLREMELGEIIDALAFDFSEDKLMFDEDERMEAQALLNACGSLVSVPQNWDNNSVVRLSHASVKDYFLNSGSTKWGVQVSDQQAQSLIAKTCLAYFNSLNSNVLDAKQKYPLVEYASRYWDTHLNCYKNFGGDQSMCDLFQELLQENNPKYILLKELLSNYFIRFGIGPPLCLVAYLGIQQGAQLLLEHHADPNMVGEQYGTGLQVAAHQENIDIVQLLLEHNADPDIIGGHHGTALQAAAYKENIDIVQLLLDHNADPNIAGGEYGTALQAAAHQENIDIVQLLLEHNADPNIIGGQYGTALQAAALRASIDIVQLLLEHNADPNIAGGEYGTALQAAFREHIDIVQLLLEHNANPNIMDGEYAHEKNIEIARILLEHNADPNILGGTYGTALQTAAYWGKIDIVQLLLEHNADPNIMGGEYGTALHAAAHGKNIEIARMLLEHNADPNIMGGMYGTALQAAAYQGKIDIVQLLLEHNADPNILGGQYDTALQAAAYMEKIDIVQLLLEHNADPNIMGGEYGTALQAAAYGDNIDIVKLLLELGVDVNIPGGRFGTPLQAAAAWGKIGVVKLLLKHSADVTLQGGEYGNALKAATAQGHSVIGQLLQAHGAM
ncbi:ankyrin repeat-containing domain protein [Mycena sanguinolenta]|nr:ankyrin repeat-containing domain protein [Mycena sanguinolenta]